nr:zinc finger BED domain-containing protein RICESLEEPER 2 [Tanacetum cinerariifolium]
ISRTKYVTSHTLIVELSTIHELLRKQILCDVLNIPPEDEVLYKIGKVMKKKFDKYYREIENMNALLYFAFLLDPRNKDDFLQIVVDDHYGAEGLAVVKLKKKYIHAQFKALYEDYVRIHAPRSNSSSVLGKHSDDTTTNPPTRDSHYSINTPLIHTIFYSISNINLTVTIETTKIQDLFIQLPLIIYKMTDGQDAVWKNQKSVHGLELVKSWKLLTSCGVHIITLSTIQLILLVERIYPLSRFTLEQLMNVTRLQVEEESEMSLELLRGRSEIYKQGPKVEESAPKALMAIDGVGWDWSYMANEEENHALVVVDEAPTEFSLMAKSSSSSKNEDSGCSRYMTGNISYLSDYEPYDGGYVSFGQGGGKITGKECIVLGRNFKLKDDTNVLLRTPRQHNMLGHLNFKTMNKLVRHNLVKGLPSKCFENDHTCVACLKEKQHKASCKTKLVNSVSKPLYTLHMDLFGPTSVTSLNYKWHFLVVTDDFSRKSSIMHLAKPS